MVLTRDINFRDPFVLPVSGEKLYYLYGTGGTDAWDWVSHPKGFVAYRSADLLEWEGPFVVFEAEPDFWADRDFWAPEVHQYHGCYFMFATFKSPNVHRGTQVLISDSPLGPFKPHSAGPVTPANWECLDGTLYVDTVNNPWIVFCHEWTQIHDGEIHALRLTDDLSAPLGEPVLLFRASEACWAKPIPFATNQDFCTDGPFLYRSEDRTLTMLWSTIGEGGLYTQGAAYSLSGELLGPWKQYPEPLYSNDGGHGMLFRSFENELFLVLHQPNTTPNERPLFLPVTRIGSILKATL